MPLIDLVYQCVECGSDAMRESREDVVCVDCGAVHRHLAETGWIQISGSEGEIRRLRPHEISTPGGGVEDPPGGPEILRETAAHASFAAEEGPVRYRGALIGFFERVRPGHPGRLRLTTSALEFDEPDGTSHSWALIDVRAVQTASSAVQISPRDGGLVSFKFPGESSRRWEDLLKSALRLAWRQAGRGEIVEFQPRVRVRN